MEYQLVGFHIATDDHRNDLLLAFIFLLLKVKAKMSSKPTKNIN